MGQRLSKPIYWRGSQWAVTSYGIEALDGSYAIPKERLYEGEEDDDTGGLSTGHTWWKHMREKEWVHMVDFGNALALAQKRWPR